MDASAPADRTDIPDCPDRYPLAIRSIRSLFFLGRPPFRRYRRAEDPNGAQVVLHPRWNLYLSLLNLNQGEKKLTFVIRNNV